MDLYKQSRNPKYENKFLIWAIELVQLRSLSSSPYVNWHVYDSLDKTFTKESILDAVDNRLGRFCPYQETYFIEIDYDDLVEYIPHDDTPEINKEEMVAWLKDQLTDMSSYDPRGEMDEGEHIFGALARRQAREENNIVINAIINELKQK